MQSNFDRSLSAVLKHEGGYVDHPKDPGGATNKGITLATFRRLVKPGGTKADLKQITTEQVRTAYKKGFWAQIMADDLPSGLDYAVFDYAVNSGPGRAAKALQALVGAKPDGVIGHKTLLAVVAVKNLDDLIEDLCAQRLAFVKRLATWPTFGKGWEKRIAAVRVLALAMAAGAVPAPPAPEVPPSPETPPTGLAAALAAALAAFLKFIISLFARKDSK